MPTYKYKQIQEQQNIDLDPNSDILAGKLVANALQQYSSSLKTPDYKDIVSFASNDKNFTITFKRYLNSLEDIDKNIILLNNACSFDQHFHKE